VAPYQNKQASLAGSRRSGFKEAFAESGSWFLQKDQTALAVAAWIDASSYVAF
jgi:hypothetical protein